MPQFDLSTFSAQIFWLVLTFSALNLYVALYIVPRMRKIYDLRWKRTRGLVLEAEKLDQEAQELDAAMRAELERARKKAALQMSEAQARINGVRGQRFQEIQKSLKNRLHEAENRIEDEKARAYRDLQEEQDQLCELALAVVLKGTAPGQAERPEGPRKGDS